NRFEVFDRPINETAGSIPPGQWRHERIRAGRKHELVVRELAIFRRRHALGRSIDRYGPLIEMQLDAVAIEEVGLDERQILRALAREERGEPHAIIGRSRLLAEYRDLEVVGFAGDVLQQALSD